MLSIYTLHTRQRMLAGVEVQIMWLHFASLQENPLNQSAVHWETALATVKLGHRGGISLATLKGSAAPNPMKVNNGTITTVSSSVTHLHIREACCRRHFASLSGIRGARALFVCSHCAGYLSCYILARLDIKNSSAVAVNCVLYNCQ